MIEIILQALFIIIILKMGVVWMRWQNEKEAENRERILRDMWGDDHPYFKDRGDA